MRTLRLLSTAAAILLLGAGAASAQGMKNDTTPAAPTAQQNAPPEKVAPVAKSDPIKTPENKAPEKSGQATPAAPTSKQQTTEKGAPASAAAKDSADANGGTDVKSKRAERHVGGRYAGYRHGPLYNSYRGDRWYHGCHRHSLTPWLWC